MWRFWNLLSSFGFFGSSASFASLARRSSRSTLSHSSMVDNRWRTPLSPGMVSFAPPYLSSPLDANAMWVIQDSIPSKMCVAYTIVTFRSSHSRRKNDIKSALPSTSRSTVISSKSKTCV